MTRRIRRNLRRSKCAQTDSETILMKASLAQKEGRLAEAEKGYREVLKTTPDWGQVLNALGTVYLDKGQPDKAKQTFTKAAALKPLNVAACYNLAMLQQRENDHLGAIILYKTILEAQPDFGQAWNNLGVAYRETMKPDEALSCFQKAVEFAPEMAEAWNNMGVAQDEFNKVEDAAICYRRAIELRPEYTSAHFNLGMSLQKLKQFEEAEQHYNRVLKTKPDDEAAQFMLQSLGTMSATPDAAPAEHVRRIFDQCAGTFEKILVQDLEYRTPELLFDLVSPHLTEEMNILDLGCGTGLGAQLYRPFAKRLTGVDVSPKMVAKAEAKNIYDSLEVFDVLQDWNFPEQFGLIYSSDVFVYFGNLKPILHSMSSTLTDCGIIAFSVEYLEDSSDNYRLFPTGRYAHSDHYIYDCLEKNGFELLTKTESDIRKQSGNKVRGLLFVAQKR
ncbi:tetratricopeptide repeat protein [Desulfopila sp. IMCC35008]|uniref:tetratricopeptide repeat protein n=1 Tax=Desulfopila sp. IMCC35008 TaxID=2653858 RepID=UPI0013D0746B|nr:tetratricopeptide repeat protein [Desulfopila sp. IMCC35008]